MTSWDFIGKIPSSKSLYLRALLAKSFFSDFEIIGHAASDDVALMEVGLQQLGQDRVIDCGHAGAVLRFLALRAARIAGVHQLTGSERLFERPQGELLRTLMQLGCEVTVDGLVLKIRSWGWKLSGDALHIKTQESSQFVSAVLLNAWDLPQPLFIQLGRDMASAGYFAMTCRFLENLGLRIEPWKEGIHVPAKQKLQAIMYEVEPDMSCAFALAALAAVSGRATLVGFPQNSLQPDHRFVELLQKMGVGVRRDQNNLIIERGAVLRPLSCNLKDTPDLFPSLASLCALAEGESELRGAQHLQWKESDRIANTAELIRLMGRECVVFADGLKIRGRSVRAEDHQRKDLVFDPDEDHRMAMAAAVFKKAGIPLMISDPQVVSKSFANFWQLAGLKP